MDAAGPERPVEAHRTGAGLVTLRYQRGREIMLMVPGRVIEHDPSDDNKGAAVMISHAGNAYFAIVSKVLLAPDLAGKRGVSEEPV